MWPVWFFCSTFHSFEDVGLLAAAGRGPSADLSWSQRPGTRWLLCSPKGAAACLSLPASPQYRRPLAAGWRPPRGPHSGRCSIRPPQPLPAVLLNPWAGFNPTNGSPSEQPDFSRRDHQPLPNPPHTHTHTHNPPTPKAPRSLIKHGQEETRSHVTSRLMSPYAALRALI